MAEKVSWSDLPEDLWTKIGKCLDSQFDIIRFRSVCRRWRHSISAARSDSLLGLWTDPNSSDIIPPTLFIISVCILNQYPISSPISKPWLFRLEETPDQKFCIVNPLWRCPVKDEPTTFPKFLNLLDYPILEVAQGYVCSERTFITYDDQETEILVRIGLGKVVTLPESGTDKDENTLILCLFPNGGLLLWRYGEKKYKPLYRYVNEDEDEDEDWFLSDDKDEDEFCYGEIAVYRGRFVVVDGRGTLYLVDFSSSKLIKYTLPIFNGGSQKHLVVSSETLYVVNRYISRALGKRAVAFKVYKLDEEWGWVEVLSLDDRIVIIGEKLNFFVPIKELGGCKGDCIYFIDYRRWYGDEDDALIGSTGHGTAVFDLANGRIGNLSSFSGLPQLGSLQININIHIHHDMRCAQATKLSHFCSDSERSSLLNFLSIKKSNGVKT